MNPSGVLPKDLVFFVYFQKIKYFWCFPSVPIEDHHLIEWGGIEKFQLERTYKDHLVQLLDHFRADQKLNQLIKAIVQMPLKIGGLKYLNIWRLSKNPEVANPFFSILPIRTSLFSQGNLSHSSFSCEELRREGKSVRPRNIILLKYFSFVQNDRTMVWPRGEK